MTMNIKVVFWAIIALTVGWYAGYISGYSKGYVAGYDESHDAQGGRYVYSNRGLQ